MILVLLSLFTALAESPQSDALEAKKTDLIELRQSVVTQYKSVIHGPSKSRLHQAVNSAQTALLSAQTMLEHLETMTKTELEQELARVEAREPKTDSDLELIEESYESRLREQIASNNVARNELVVALRDRVNMLAKVSQDAEDALAAYDSVVERVAAIDAELAALGVHPEPIVPETGWSRHVPPDPHVR